MRPIFFTLQNDKNLMIVPDTQAHLDGHEVITYTYGIYAGKHDGDAYPAQRKEDTLHLDENTDPDYYGYVTFDKPGSLFTYTSDGKLELTAEESNEVIEYISHVRDDGGWKNNSRGENLN